MAPELDLDRSVIDGAAARNDVAVFTIGRMSGEGEDRSRGKGDYLLSDQELSMLEDVCNAFHNAGKNVIVVVNAGDAIEFTGWNHMPDAVLMAWLPGQEAGNAVADVLSGMVNPSGRLPMTFAKSYDDIPSSSNFGVSQGETNAVRYEEDLMVGYRYFTTAGVEPEYPFGYGLSYTSFSYESMKVAGMDEEGNVRIKVTVRNVGDVPGKEIVQVYVGKPAISAGRPVMELCAFARTHELMPGELAVVDLVVDGDNLRQWDDQTGAWTVADGMYVFSAGTLAEEIEL